MGDDVAVSWERAQERLNKKTTRSAAKNEPAPTGTGKKVIDEVVLDLNARSDMGEKKYGTPLRTFNGRNAMMDLYQELLDSVMYAKQVLMEMEDMQKIVDTNYKLVKELKYNEHCKF